MRLHERLAAIRSARLDAVNKSILFVLAGYAADDEERPVWPSVVTIAADAGVNKDTVTARMTALAGLGLIVQTRKHGMGQNARYRVAWDLVSTCDARPVRRSVIARQDPTGPDLVTASGVGQDPTGSDDKIRPDRISRSDGVGREDPTGSDITIHENRSEGTDQVNRPLAREPDPHLLTALLFATRSDHMHSLLYERVTPGIVTGSRPTMDADPIDNDGATTPSPFRATPSPTEVTDGQAAPHHAQPAGLHRLPDAAGPVLPDAAPETALEVASTLSPAPATSETSASIATESGSLPLAFDAPPAFVWLDKPEPKPKRKAKEKTETDAQRRKRERAEQAAAEAETMLAAWGLACQSYDTISGKVRKWDPTRGDGRLIAETMAKEGQARIVARFAQAARDPWCLDRRPDLAALCRGATPFVSRLDAAAEQATLDAESRSEAVATSGGMVTHPSAQNAPERQPAPKQNGSAAWDDMLTVIRSTGGLRLSLGLRGSTLSHDAVEHKRRCQAVADIGGWAKLCELNDFNRMAIRAQFVSAYDRAGVSA